MARYDIVKCTRCGRTFEDLRIKTTLSIQVDRLTETGLWEEIPNLYQVSQDYLCKECFDNLANILEKMNEPYSEEDKKRMEQKKENILDGIELLKENDACSCSSDSSSENASTTNQIQNVEPPKSESINPLDLIQVESDCQYSTN